MTPEPTPAQQAPAYRFGRFARDPAQRRLVADGKLVPLGSRGFDLLLALVARAGRLVSKNELLTLVWAGLVVEENNLQVQVSALRKLLGPGALARSPAAVIASSFRSTGTAQPRPPRRCPRTRRRSRTHRRRRPTSPRAGRPLYGRDADLAAVHALVRPPSFPVESGGSSFRRSRTALSSPARSRARSVRNWVRGPRRSQRWLRRSRKSGGTGAPALPARRPAARAHRVVLSCSRGRRASRRRWRRHNANRRLRAQAATSSVRTSRCPT
jgi:hypothetical protein